MPDGLLPLAEVSRLLGVNRARVQAMVQSGQLEAERVGSQWVVPAAALRRRRLMAPGHGGRPVSARTAWARLRELEADPRRLVDDLDGARRRVLRRAERSHRWVHPETLAELRAAPGVVAVLGGREAADHHGVPAGAGGELDVYVPAVGFEDFSTSIGGRPEPVDPNLFVHVVADDAWNEVDPDGDGFVDVIVALMDLADRADRATDVTLATLLNDERA